MSIYSLGERTVRLPASGSYWIAPNAVIVGDVRIADDVSIWFGASIRGDNEPIEIGAGTNIQEGSVLHVDPGFPMQIGADCTIGHMVMLHGCTVGRGCLVGIGAIVLNGARIGDGCLIGAGALVPEGREIPPGSLVLGSPGKVVRRLTEQDQARIAEGASVYKRRWRHYEAELRPQDG